MVHRLHRTYCACYAIFGSHGHRELADKVAGFTMNNGDLMRFNRDLMG
jgi:hypothetical protein